VRRRHERRRRAAARGAAPPTPSRLLVEAARLWRGCRARYETARVRLLLARAYRTLGDLQSAARELDVADATFAELGAVPDRAAVAMLRAPVRRLPGGLTGREVDVLACLARGRTNRQIAEAFTISEKIVEHHLTNIFTKLDVTSRMAAAGFAHEHGLLRVPDAAAAADGDFAR
jgi:DNA-binding NarL/FixJ family response regulator